MKTDYAVPIVASAKAVFATMLDADLEPGKPVLNDRFQPQYDVTALIGVSGQVRGTVIVSLSRDAAIGATAKMLGKRPESIDADVVDAVGELTNMIVGGAKSELEELGLCMALPTVIIGRDPWIRFGSLVQSTCISFGSSLGPLSIEFGFSQNRPDGQPTCAPHPTDMISAETR